MTGQRAEAAIAQSEALSASVEHADTLQGAELEDKVKDLKKARFGLLQNLGYVGNAAECSLALDPVHAHEAPRCLQ